MKKFLIFFLLASPLMATERTTARFLSLGVGARELAMGSAASAVTKDINAIYWNPAGLTRLSSRQIGGTHAEWFLDTQYDFVGVAAPSPIGTFAFSWLYFGSRNQDGRDENRQATGDFSASDVAVSVAYARPFTSKVSLGSNVKLVQSRIADEEASTVAVDVGFQYAFANSRLPRLGVAARNMGPSLKFVNQSDPLPTTLALGLSQPVFRTFLLAGEWQYEPHDEQHQLTFGVEVQTLSAVTLRGGYLSPVSGGALLDGVDSQDQFKGFAGGLGFQLSRFQLDYAFKPFDTLGETHRLSLLSPW